MSNSPLVVYTKISPNKTSPRNHIIDTITIHTMAGNCTVETCGEIFTPTSRQASSNYGIDSKGRIAMYVEEKDRSWCSSNKANDHRAVTIEVASTNNTDYAPSNDAYNALINLCVDICKRNNIKQLLWKGDKNLIGQIDQQNMTVHRWFKNKACPGDWLYNHMGEIASDVNTKLNDGSKVVVPVVETNETRLYKFLKAKGLNDNAIYGIIGNIFAESGCQSQNLQNSFEKKLGYSDDEYTSAVDNGSYTNFIHDSAGYGLCQWTYWSRKQNLFNFAKKQGVSIGNMDMQMNFFWQELQGYKGIIDSLKKCNTIKEASNIMLHQYEKPADQSATVENKRAKYGEEAKVRIEATLAGKTSATVTNTTSSTTTTSSKVINGITVKPYTVKILVDALNYRNGPGTNYGRLGTVKKGSIYTIIEESEDRAWGKLKSGAGWISLNSKYVSKTSTSTNTTTNTASKLPYTIKITCNALNYRKGPGTNYATVGTVKKGQVFTIVEEKTGTGAKLWGKLKSGAGWIAIDERYNIKN